MVSETDASVDLKTGDIVALRTKTGETCWAHIRKVGRAGVMFDEPIATSYDKWDFDLDGPIRNFQAKVREYKVVGNLSSDCWRARCRMQENIWMIYPENLPVVSPVVSKEEWERFKAVDEKICEFFENLPPLTNQKPN